MTLQFIEGGAGTGKTTAIMKAVAQRLAKSPLAQHQRVLALTKMHGSRRRMRARLAAIQPLNGRFESVTMDSFAGRIVSRWRSLARVLGGPTPTDFDGICDRAGMLLEEPSVQKWIAASFPIVVVDELQDSKGGQLRMLKALCARCECIAAGDPFQDLDGDEACASIDWARQQTVPTVLTITHRTNKPGLLAAATALREGQEVSAASGFLLAGVDGYGLGAWEVAKTIAKWRKLGTIAVISPTTEAKSKFVRQLVERINSEPPLGKKWKVGPFRVPWETAREDQVERSCRALGLPEDGDAVVRADALQLVGERSVGAMRSWLSRQRRLFGRREFSATELREAVQKAVQQGRIYGREQESPISVMSIHQAKNREFDRVFLLWPYEVKGSNERLRRLAYNAITRARHEAYVIVQSKARVGQVPFARPTPPAP